MKLLNELIEEIWSERGRDFGKRHLNPWFGEDLEGGRGPVGGAELGKQPAFTLVGGTQPKSWPDSVSGVMW